MLSRAKRTREFSEDHLNVEPGIRLHTHRRGSHQLGAARALTRLHSRCEARRLYCAKWKSNICDSSHNKVPAQANVTQIPKAITSNGHRGGGDRVAGVEEMSGNRSSSPATRAVAARTRAKPVPRHPRQDAEQHCRPEDHNEHQTQERRKEQVGEDQILVNQIPRTHQQGTEPGKREPQGAKPHGDQERAVSPGEERGRKHNQEHEQQQFQIQVQEITRHLESGGGIGETHELTKTLETNGSSSATISRSQDLAGAISPVSIREKYNDSIWHEAADSECPLSRQVSTAKPTCDRHR